MWALENVCAAVDTHRLTHRPDKGEIIMKLSLQDVLRGIAKTVGAGGVVSIASECKVNLELKSTYSWLLLLASCTASQLATVATLDPTPMPVCGLQVADVLPTCG